MGGTAGDVIHMGACVGLGARKEGNKWVLSDHEDTGSGMMAWLLSWSRISREH